MGVGDQAFISQFLRHVKDIVDLDDTEIRVKPLEPFMTAVRGGLAVWGVI